MALDLPVWKIIFGPHESLNGQLCASPLTKRILVRQVWKRAARWRGRAALDPNGWSSNAPRLADPWRSIIARSPPDCTKGIKSIMHDLDVLGNMASA